MLGENAKNVVLGLGVFKVDGTAVGLTRDGGEFKVEYNYRRITADGDRGTVKGRVVKEEAKPFITINHLELLTAFEQLHTGIVVDTTTNVGYTTVKGTGKIDDEKDYHVVTFEGLTKDGREVIITIQDAINLENINWALKDKEDIIDTVTYEGTYDSTVEDGLDERWSVQYKTAKV